MWNSNAGLGECLEVKKETHLRRRNGFLKASRKAEERGEIHRRPVFTDSKKKPVLVGKSFVLEKGPCQEKENDL